MPSARTRRLLVLLACLVPVALVVYAVEYDRRVGLEHGWVHDPVERALVHVVAAGSLYAHRRAWFVPVVLAAAAWALTGSALLVIVASVLLGARRPRGWSAAAFSLAALHPLGIAPTPLSFAAGQNLLPEILIPVYSVLFPLSLGIAVSALVETARLRESHLEQLVVLENERARAAAVSERLRISRDMHDVIGHHLSLMVLRATALAASTTDDASRVLAEKIAGRGATALDDLRVIITVLPAGEGDEAGSRRGVVQDASTPMTGVERLAAATEDAAEGGTVVTTSGIEHLVVLPPTLEIALIDVAVEGVHNATKHAPGQPVEVTFGTGAGRHWVQVENAQGTPGATLHPGGLGLDGLRDRMRERGGELTATTSADGHFIVVARLPGEVG